MKEKVKLMILHLTRSIGIFRDITHSYITRCVKYPNEVGKDMATPIMRPSHHVQAKTLLQHHQSFVMWTNLNNRLIRGQGLQENCGLEVGVLAFGEHTNNGPCNIQS